MDNLQSIDAINDVDRVRLTVELGRLTDAIDLGTYRKQHNELFAARQALCWALDPEVAASPLASIMDSQGEQGDCLDERCPKRS